MDEAREFIRQHWADAGNNVIAECEKVIPFNDNFDKFLDHCVACGGDWGGMLLSGIKELYPEVWNAIPNDMGSFAWPCLCDVLTLCGVQINDKEGE